MEVLLMRWEAPLLSFGGLMVDQQGVIQAFPALSMVTGLLGNALGYDHSEVELLQSLQGRLSYAVRADIPGHRMMDYQTVDLGQDFLVDTGWTTRGAPSERGKGEATSGTHIRFRDYIADALYLVAVTVTDGFPTVKMLGDAVREPSRPLFLGRKTCVPSSPMYLGIRESPSLLASLRAEPRLQRGGRRAATLPYAEPLSPGIESWWPDDGDTGSEVRRVQVTDQRDWKNQLHVGLRTMRHGLIAPFLPPREVSNG
jgi:CRISPR system Cascade subunit CasD